MTDQEMRIAIGKACGKINAHCRRALKHFKNRNGYLDTVLQYEGVPDYPNDLNACHEMEKRLPKKGLVFHDYTVHLLVICHRATNHTYCATARQRCEAFLRAIGKWRDDNATVKGKA